MCDRYGVLLTCGGSVLTLLYFPDLDTAVKSAEHLRTAVRHGVTVEVVVIAS